MLSLSCSGIRACRLMEEARRGEREVVGSARSTRMLRSHSTWRRGSILIYLFVNVNLLPSPSSVIKECKKVTNTNITHFLPPLSASKSNFLDFLACCRSIINPLEKTVDFLTIDLQTYNDRKESIHERSPLKISNEISYLSFGPGNHTPYKTFLALQESTCAKPWRSSLNLLLT